MDLRTFRTNTMDLHTCDETLPIISRTYDETMPLTSKKDKQISGEYITMTPNKY